MKLRQRKTGLLTKVLLTNGEKFVEVFWLSHSGTDVYCGPSFTNSHRSYHCTGKVHSKLSGYRCNEKNHIPLNAFVGEFFLEGLGIANVPEWFADHEHSLDFRGGKTDTLLVIDLRTVPSDVTVNLRIGLLQASRTDLLLPEIASFDVKQILFMTSTTPWIYTVVYWVRAAQQVGVRRSFVS
jgi:hypothetical protein